MKISSYGIREVGLAMALVGALVSTSARAAGDPCREWQDEHAMWRSEVVRLYLNGASQRALDEAVFELVQREAYLTSCPASVPAARPVMVGWRLVDRSPDDYASAVVESLLEQAGFDLSLRSLVGRESQEVRRARAVR
jgi:hypothetical protein